MIPQHGIGRETVAAGHSIQKSNDDAVWYENFDKENNAKYDSVTGDYIVAADGNYTLDSEGVKEVYENGHMKIDGDVYAEDRSAYVREHTGR